MGDLRASFRRGKAPAFGEWSLPGRARRVPDESASSYDSPETNDPGPSVYGRAHRECAGAPKRLSYVYMQTGTWRSCSGGAIELGENSLDAARRETLEETGLRGGAAPFSFENISMHTLLTTLVFETIECRRGLRWHLAPFTSLGSAASFDSPDCVTLRLDSEQRAPRFGHAERTLACSLRREKSTPVSRELELYVI